jgi:hypothetical protein
VFQSPLSKAFNGETSIKSEIDISEFFSGSIKIQIEEQLVTSTSEFIRNIERKIKNTMGRKPSVKDQDHELILKTKGEREYFEGNFQLLQYEKVRTCLRKKTDMKLILT